ncbi:MAG: PAS domain-containing sensor histidine kinase [Candidatus Helarchaeota archaeon]
MDPPLEHYQEILENINDLILEIYTDGTIFYVSPQAPQIFGYSPQDLIGLNFFDFVDPEDLPFALKNIKNVSNQATEIAFDLKIRHKEGHSIYISLKGKFLKRKGKQKLIAVLRDITKRKEVETKLKKALEELRQKNEELMELDQLKDEFYDDICHELCTPLISIRGFTEILLNSSKLEDEVIQDLQIILKNELRLENLVNDIIYYSRLKEGKNTFKQDRFYVSEIIDEILNEFQIFIQEKFLKIEVKFHENHEISLDRFHIKKLIQNLLIIAIKFSEENGKIIIESNVADSFWTFLIHNEGISSIGEEIPKLFSQFIKFDSRKMINVKKVGVGLALCIKIIELYNGKFWVEAKESHEGTAFCFKIPLKIQFGKNGFMGDVKNSYQCSEPSKIGSSFE